jgi:DNA-binding HxlR family transcriptional regulator
MFKPLDPLLHSHLRLAIVSLLSHVESAEFVFLKEKTKTSAGNLSLQLSKLQESGYVNIDKGFKGKYPLTTCKLTEKGRAAFLSYIEALKDYIG